MYYEYLLHVSVDVLYTVAASLVVAMQPVTGYITVYMIKIICSPPMQFLRR